MLYKLLTALVAIPTIRDVCGPTPPLLFECGRNIHCCYPTTAGISRVCCYYCCPSFSSLLPLLCPCGTYCRLAPRHVTHEVLLQLHCLRNIRQSPNLLKTFADKGFIQSVHKKLSFSPQQLILSLSQNRGAAKTCIYMRVCGCIYMRVGIVSWKQNKTKKLTQKTSQATNSTFKSPQALKHPVRSDYSNIKPASTTTPRQLPPRTYGVPTARYVNVHAPCQWQGGESQFRLNARELSSG